MKLGKNQILRPSGVIQSKDGKYFYWSCSISGTATFANAERWGKVLARFGNDETRLMKEFVCRPAQKLIDQGVTDPKEITKALTSGSANRKEKKVKKLSPAQAEKAAVKAEKLKRKELIKAEKLSRKKRKLSNFAIDKVDVLVQNDSGSFEVEKKPVYPWQNDPTYFSSGIQGTMSVAEATRDSCALPNRYLDDECRNCPLYKDCAFERKFTEDDWKKGKRAMAEVKITPIRSFAD